MIFSTCSYCTLCTVGLKSEPETLEIFLPKTGGFSGNHWSLTACLGDGNLRHMFIVLDLGKKIFINKDLNPLTLHNRSCILPSEPLELRNNFSNFIK